MAFRKHSRATGAWLLLVLTSRVAAYDFQYFLPQEFLSDLPLREGSFADQVIHYLRNAVFPDVHHKNVDPGIFINAYATSDFNSASYRSRRDVCLRVPVGSNPRGAPDMCENADAQLPKAEILTATSAGEIGKFMLSAEFEFRVPGHLKIESKICFVICGHDTICDDDVMITGVLRVESLVVVSNVENKLKLQPTTTVFWLSGPTVKGCHPDVLVRLFVDVKEDLSEGIQNIVQAYVDQNLQSQLVLPQTMRLHPGLNLTYELQELQFVFSTDPSNQSFVIAHASCTFYALAQNGSIQAFPDATAPWTGKHNPLPMNDPWRRTMGTGLEQLVLLGGARISEDLQTNFARSMHYAGMLISHNSSDVKDARLFSTLDMSCPQVDISKERGGVVMRQDHLHFQIDCLDKEAANASNFSLLNATFSNVLEEVSISAYVPNDHTAGIMLQILNVSMGSANVSAFHSHTFLGSGSDLKALALQAIRKSLPLMNHQLKMTPIIFCGGGSAACALVPFAPHPTVSTSPRGPMKPGYVQLIWQCQCGSSDFYESCAGFRCPEVRRPETRPLQVRQLRKITAEHDALVSERLASLPKSPGPAWISLFSSQKCSFTRGQAITFANVMDGQCAASDHPSLSPAFKLHSYKDVGWHLYSGCQSDDCSACGTRHWIPLRRCTCLTSSGPCIVVSSSSDGCVAAEVGGLQSYPEEELVLVSAENGRSTFLKATRIQECSACGVDGSLKCKASSKQGLGDLFCETCLLKECAMQNVVLGQHEVPKTLLGNRSGYSEVILATPRTFPLMRACAAGHDVPDPGKAVPFLPLALVAGAVVIFAWGLLLWKFRRHILKLRLWVRWKFTDRFEREKRFHLSLWLGCAVLAACSLVWLYCNPLEGELNNIKATMDTSNFDWPAAIHIVQTARCRGTLILLMCGAVLLLTSLFRLLQHVCVRCGTAPPEQQVENSDGMSSRWRSVVVFFLTEAGAAISLLAFCFWQHEFSSSFERQKHSAGDLGFLSGAVASSASATFCIRLVLSWIGPVVINLSLSNSVLLLVASVRPNDAANPSLHSWVLGILLIQQISASILAIAYFHSGYASTSLLWLVIGSGMLNAVWFVLLFLRWLGKSLLFICGCLFASQMVVNGMVGWIVADRSLLPFLICSTLATVCLSWLAATLFNGLDSPQLQDLRALHSEAIHEARADCMSVLTLFVNCVLEKEEAKSNQFGARIKWRRLCAILGCAGLLVDLKRSVWHNCTYTAWDDLSSLIASWIGSDALIDHDPNSVLYPLVKQYGSARALRLLFSAVGASCFTVAALSDMVGSSLAMRWDLPAIKFLRWSRRLGFLGSLGHTVATFEARTFFYASGLLVFNLPDYVGLLDFGSLHRCGSQFCKAVGGSMKSAVGSGLLAKAGTEFLPLLVCLAWTSFRIGFFLASDPKNVHLVNALMWVTLSSMLRLSPLAGTAAFIASPKTEVIVWFSAFLLLPALLLSIIVRFRLTNLAWYFLWGWVFYLVPLLVMASYALGMDFLTLICRFLDYLREDWPSFLAEFFLSDVVISDLFFTMVFSEG